MTFSQPNSLSLCHLPMLCTPQSSSNKLNKESLGFDKVSLSTLIRSVQLSFIILTAIFTHILTSISISEDTENLCCPTYEYFKQAWISNFFRLHAFSSRLELAPSLLQWLGCWANWLTAGGTWCWLARLSVLMLSTLLNQHITRHYNIVVIIWCTSSSSIGACRWRCCSCECPPSCSVLSSPKPWREAKMHSSDIYVSLSQLLSGSLLSNLHQLCVFFLYPVLVFKVLRLSLKPG